MEAQSVNAKSQERISSPDQLHDFLHVTNSAVWLVLVAVILLLIVSLVWSSKATIDTYRDATVTVKDGAMVVRLVNPRQGETLYSSMTVYVGDTSSQITSVGHDPKGRVFGVAATTLADGDYNARVLLRQTQVLGLLFGN